MRLPIAVQVIVCHRLRGCVQNYFRLQRNVYEFLKKALSYTRLTSFRFKPTVERYYDENGT